MTIERVSFSQVDRAMFHERYQRPGTPVVITDAVQLTEPWDLDFISERLRDRVFPARYYGEQRFTVPKDAWTDYCGFRELTFGQYADTVRDRSAHRENVYMAQIPIGDTSLSVSIRQDVEAFAARTGLERAVDLNLWVGPAGHTEPLHYDSHDGTLLQLRGSKRCVLFPPEQTDALYPFPLLGTGLAPWISQVYVERPDPTRFPRLHEALRHRREVILQPGEILFIPARWWHEVSALGDDYVCSINRFWRVKPLRRVLVNPRAAAIYLSGKIPVGLFRTIHGNLTRLHSAWSRRA